MALKYDVALINVWWSENSTDTRMFNSLEEQTSYFESLAQGRYSTLQNFPVLNNIDTTLTYRDTTNIDINELIACNYMVVRRVNNDDTYTYRYYFAYCRQDSGRQLILDLSLDDIQTNFMKYKSNIKDCFIRRAHLNRFVLENNKYKFDNSLNSKLYLNENMGNHQKRLIRREKLKLKVDNGVPEEALNNWLNENVSCWNIIFIRGEGTTYKSYGFVYNESTGSNDYKLIDTLMNNIEYESNILGTGGVICVPVYKTNKRIKCQSPGVYFEISNKGLKEFRKLNNDTSYFFANKITLRPPFLFDVYKENEDYSIDSNGDLLIMLKNNNSTELKLKGCNIIYTTESGATFSGVLNVTKSGSKYETESFEVTPDISFNKTDITGNKNYKLNPKLLSTDFYELNITNGTPEYYTYDFQKIGVKSLKLDYSETLVADVTKAYTRLKANSVSDIGEVLIPETADSFIGLLYNNDNSIPYSNDALQSMLANNKNFFLQNSLQRTGDLAKNITSIGGGYMQGYEASGLLLGAYQTALNYYMSKESESLNVDNLRQAPDSIVNANGNVLFTNDVSEMGIYVEEYQALPVVLESSNDIMFKFGFSLNIIDNINNYFIRKYFNYIEANIEVIDAPISIDEKNRIRNLFDKGIRFWNSDNIQYTLENYEGWLDNEN